MSAYPLEHRAVAQRMLGRPLRSDEVVHHVNRITSDNRPVNLRVLTKGEHRRLHAEEAKVAFDLHSLRVTRGLSRERLARLLEPQVTSKSIQRWEFAGRVPRKYLAQCQEVLA